MIIIISTGTLPIAIEIVKFVIAFVVLYGQQKHRLRVM